MRSFPSEHGDRWLAGFMDGQGSVTLVAHPGRRPELLLRFSSVISDANHEVRRRAALRGRLTGPHGARGIGTQVWWQLIYSNGDAAAILRRVLPYMHTSRAKTFRGLLTAWEKALERTEITCAYCAKPYRPFAIRKVNYCSPACGQKARSRACGT